jgi:predicted nucleic acid-binding Zn ribbon protein
VSYCPVCGKRSPPCPETGYDGEGFCSQECEEKASMKNEEQVVIWFDDCPEQDPNRATITRAATFPALEQLHEKVVKAALDYAFTSELPYDLRRAVRELREASQ